MSFPRVLLVSNYSAVKSRDRNSIQQPQKMCFPLTKEAFIVEASAVEDKGQFHIASSDIPELRDVKEAASCCSQATAPSTKYRALCM